jgi:hypothetical protein
VIYVIKKLLFLSLKKSYCDVIIGIKWNCKINIEIFECMPRKSNNRKNYLDKIASTKLNFPKEQKM